MKGTTLVVLGVLSVCACGSADKESDGNAIEGTRSEGVWMFFYAPGDHGEALHTGTATIEGECLMVGGAVVVWHRESKDIADAALNAAKEGSAEAFSIGGGGISLDEDDQTIPEEIAEHCDVREVWFGSPEGVSEILCELTKPGDLAGVTYGTTNQGQEEAQQSGDRRAQT